MKHLGFLHVYIIVYCVCVRSVVGENGYRRALKKEQDVRLGQLPGNGYDRFPETFSVWFQHGDDLAHFQLSRDDVITRTLSPVLFRLSSYLPDDLMTEETTEYFAFYHNGESPDNKMRAHFVVYRPNPAGAATFYGQIISNESIFKVLPNKMSSDSYKIIEDFDSATQHSHPGTSYARKDNVVELLVWIAPDLYEFHSTRLSSTSYDVDEWLTSYSKSLTRDVDRVFRSITTTPVRVYFVGAGFDKNTETAGWFTKHIHDNALDANGALQDIAAYLSDRVRNGLIPRYDHAVILTRKILKDNISNNDKLTIAHGRMNSICSGAVGSSVSLASVSSPSFLKAIIRSIGIGFGVDEEEDFITKKTEEYEGLDITMDTYQLKFSSFGQIKLARHLLRLTQNCLQIETNDLDFHDFIQSPSFGDQSIETQCEIVFGPESPQCSKCRFGKCLNLQKASKNSISMKDSDDSMDNYSDQEMIMVMTSSIDPRSVTRDLSTKFNPVSSTFTPLSSTATLYTPTTTIAPPTRQPPRPPIRIIDVTTTAGEEPVIPSSSIVPPSTSPDTAPTNPSTMTMIISSSLPSTPDIPIDDDQRRACECCRKCKCRLACDRCPPTPGPPAPPAPPTRPLKCRGRGGCCGRRPFPRYDYREIETFYMDKNDT